jgi:hypothetical protein
MNLMQWQTKPSWGEYEAQLLERGFEPYWDLCQIRHRSHYVGMRVMRL